MVKVSGRGKEETISDMGEQKEEGRETGKGNETGSIDRWKRNFKRSSIERGGIRSCRAQSFPPSGRHLFHSGSLYIRLLPKEGTEEEEEEEIVSASLKNQSES